MNSQKYRGDISSKIIHKEIINEPCGSFTQPVIINTEYNFNDQLKYVKLLKIKDIYDDNKNYKHTVIEHHLYELPIQKKDIHNIEFMNRKEKIKENIDTINTDSLTKDEILKYANQFGSSTTEKKKYIIEMINRNHSKNIQDYYSAMKKWNGSRDTKPKYPERYKIYNSEYN